MRRDGGFTLVELLVSMSILLVIMVPLASAVIMSFQTATTEDRLGESHDRQITSTYFNRDVASTINATITPGCSGTSPFVSFRWTDPSPTGSGGAAKAADWSVVGKKLVRVECFLGQPGARQDVADQVQSATCTATPSCTAVTAPRTITLQVVQTSGRMFRLTGTRRAA